MGGNTLSTVSAGQDVLSDTGIGVERTGEFYKCQLS